MSSMCMLPFHEAKQQEVQKSIDQEKEMMSNAPVQGVEGGLHLLSAQPQLAAQALDNSPAACSCTGELVQLHTDCQRVSAVLS